MNKELNRRLYEALRFAASRSGISSADEQAIMSAFSEARAEPAELRDELRAEINRQERLVVLIEALEAAERRLVDLYRAIGPHANYDTELPINGSASGNRLADTDDVVIAARTALAQARKQP